MYDYSFNWGWGLRFFNEQFGILIVPPPFNYSDATILRTSDGGETWERIPINGIGTPTDIYYFPPGNNSPDEAIIFMSSGNNIYNSKLTSRVSEYISTILPSSNEVFRSNQSITFRWQNLDTISDQTIFTLYKVDNPNFLTIISLDTLNSSQKTLVKNFSIENENSVYNTLFYRIYNTNNINAEDISEKFFLRIPPQISLNNLTNNGYLFIGDTVNIKIKSYAVEKLKIQLSIDSGNNWIDISNTIHADSNKILNLTFNWIVQQVPNKNCYIRAVRC